MRKSVLMVLGSGLLKTAVLAAPQSLAEVAERMVSRLPAGAIVTGEFHDGVSRFALAGKGLPNLAPERHVFEIGSISKVFTGLLLAQAVVEKKVSLTTTVGEILGADFGFADPQVAAITLEQLSTHTSGLPRLPDNLGPNPDDLADPYAAYDRAALHDFLRGAKLTAPGPHPAAYSNLGTGLLGDLLAQRLGQSWEELVRSRITQPLGLTDTVVTLTEEQQKRFAPPHVGAEAGSNWHFQALAGAGALRSTAADLIRFGQALMKPETTPFPEAIRLLTTPRAPFAGESMQIGLGLLMSRFLGAPAWEHDGGTGGYRASFQVQPESGRIRVILINNEALAPQGLLAVIDPPPSNANRSEVPITPEAAREYVGVFELSPQARFTVIQRGDHLWTRLTGQPFFRLFHAGEDRFFLKVVAAEMQFERTEGRITHVTLFQNQREQRATKSDQPPPELRFRPAKELQAFAGTYDLAPGVSFTLKVQQQTLIAQLTGQPAFPVFETKPGRFEYDVVEAALEFETDASGAVTALLLHQNGVHRAPKRAVPAEKAK